MADESELGWKVVDEYLQSEIASDEEDQKKIHRAQARARVKARSERGKRNRRWFPYRPKSATATETTTYQSQQGQIQQQQQKRPGLCFTCGQAGHWKIDCPTSKRNFKLSEYSFPFNTFDTKSSVQFDQIVTSETAASFRSGHHCKSDTCQISDIGSEPQMKDVHIPVSKEPNSEISPYNRLKNAASVWLESGANAYILNVVEHGYKIPFKELPSIQKSKNNKSARDNPEFVSKEINCLLAKGCISKVEFIPHVVNPLTVAYNKKGKPRLVLDWYCRNINKYLHTFRYKYEDMNTARQMFKKGTYMFSFDIRGAYNHIDIFPTHRTFLGFAWIENGAECIYVYNSLPFGLATAGHIFSKVLRAVVTFWRSKGHKVITFLDDGLGGDISYERAIQSSCFIRKSIQEFGFLLANEKCEWLPKLQITWLGYVICMTIGKFFITEDRIKRLEVSARSLLFQLANQKLRIVPARFAASVAGLIISMQMVLGKIVRLKTRELYKCIDSRLNWDSPVYISKKAEQEVKFWSESVRLLNDKGKDLAENLDFELMLFCDASSEGYGGFLDATCFRQTDNSSIYEQVPGTSEIEAGFSETKQHFDSTAVEACTSLHKKVEHRFPAENAGMAFLSKASPEVETGVKAQKTALYQTVDSAPSEVSSQDCSVSTSRATNFTEVAKSSSDRSATQCSGQPVTEIREHNLKYAHTEVIGVWNHIEKSKSSTWREAEAAKRILASNVDQLRGKSVRVFSDNKNVESVLQAGSSKDDLQSVALEVNRFCEENRIGLSVAWIPRSLNEKADYLSRCQDSDDWEIENLIFRKLDANWGPHTIDRYASHYNNKCERFNSRWWVPGTEGVNALHQRWSKPENNWLVPPPRLVLPTIQKMEKDQAVGTLLLPDWPSAPFYPSLFKDGKCHSFIHDIVKLPRINVVKKGLGNNGIFETSPLPFDMLALRLDFS